MEGRGELSRNMRCCFSGDCKGGLFAQVYSHRNICFILAADLVVGLQLYQRGTLRGLPHGIFRSGWVWKGEEELVLAGCWCDSRSDTLKKKGEP